MITQLATTAIVTFALAGPVMSYGEEIEYDTFVGQTQKEIPEGVPKASYSDSEWESIDFQDGLPILYPKGASQSVPAVTDDWVYIQGVLLAEDPEDLAPETSQGGTFLRVVAGHIAWDSLDDVVSRFAPPWLYSGYALWKVYPSTRSQSDLAQDESSWNPFRWKPNSTFGDFANFGFKVVETCVYGSHIHLLAVKTAAQRVISAF